MNNEGEQRLFSPEDHRRRLISASYTYQEGHRIGEISYPEPRAQLIDAILDAIKSENPDVQRMGLTAMMLNAELYSYNYRLNELTRILETDITFSKPEQY